MPLVQLVAEKIKEHAMVTAGETIVVGVSGGADSVSLLHILYRLKDELKIRLVVAHLNHRFRGEEADADARFVSELAERLHLEAYVESRDVPAYKNARGVSDQVAAREVRYNFLSEVAAKTGAARVALGHHADDQTETILLHFIRGTGTRGLRGMLPVRDNFFIRPLLTIRRKEIESYCQQHGLAYRHDASNDKTKYFRNKLRLELVPLLESNYNPNLIQAINRLGEIIREEDIYLDQQAGKAYRQARLESGGGTVRLERDRLLAIPPALRSRVIRLAWFELCGDRDDLEYKHINKVLEIIKDGGGYRQIAFPRGVTCVINYNLVELTLNHDKEAVPFYQYRINIPGITPIPEVGMSIGAQLLAREEVAYLSGAEPWEAILDYDKLSMPLVVRRRLNGDRFMPLGLDGTIKLKKFFIDNKIPLKIRDYIPLVVSGSDIVWVAGQRPGEKWKVTGETITVLRLYINNYGKNSCIS
ncbi:tRNA lysidine(34) synthetase TilS [Desulfotruncus alcoholivorax]|uniref:tRNA lysidine(34) synthetase TilS n=1 Tax=Desulfotruncus alcoholivorax TaxID=265477 RepID=UPI0003FFC0E7|nr:tRNA lysidine(34) synthetase TilS [Desulfotruncus alcoholivorax]